MIMHNTNMQSLGAAAGAKADNGNLLTMSDVYATNTSHTSYIGYGAQSADYIEMRVLAVVAKKETVDAQFCPKAGGGQRSATPT